MPGSVHRLFFAVVPDAGALAAAGRVVADLRAAKTIGGRWTAPAKYHVTAYFLGDHREPDAPVAAATAAAARIAAAPFVIEFDRVVTFRGRYQVPCVLRCTQDSDRVLTDLWQQLDRALSRHGVDGDHERRYVPHLTIAYADRMLERPIAIDPIRSPVGEFVLVDSVVGRDVHEVIGRWRLAAGAEAAPGS